MKKILTNTLIAVMIFTNSGLGSVVAYAQTEAENSPEIYTEDNGIVESKNESNSTFCVDGYLTPLEAATAYNSGLISFSLATNTSNTYATFSVLNKTNCKLPVSLSSYKMFDQTLSGQEFFHGTGLVYVKGEGKLEVKLPSCMAQIDAWYGLYPEKLLDSNPYGYPNVPFVITHKFLYNNGVGYADASGNFCTKKVNTPPVITLIGSSTVSIVEGTTYSDLGATATDLEDGNITSSIVTVSTVNSGLVGTYVVKYNVSDSKGLKATEVIRTVNVTPKPKVNTAPVITLVGSSTISILEGTTFIDPGATAQDLEDGNITTSIVASSTVNTNVPGTYTIKYNVTDSGGLYAVEVVRTVIVTVKPIIELKTATISATKIVCKSEGDLPNWGAGGPDITSTTAKTYVQNNPNCSIVPWIFEYDDATENPGDHVLSASGWTPFQSTTSIELINKKIWVREQFNPNYINFTGVNTTQNVSAELYCDTDVLNYDNYDYLVPTVKGKTYYCVAWNVLKAVTPVNTPPVITLIGANPASVNVGEAFIDPGATAQDLEDGNITTSIVASSTVNTNVPGTYTIKYNVTDSGGLHAVEVSRTVNVLEVVPQNRGKITFCLLLADSQNTLATSSYALPQGVFTMDLASTSSTGTTTIQNKTWNSNSFTPNRGIILGNDADCITYDNLPYGKYLYSTLGINGSSWNTALYNDQATQPVNNIFDLYTYGTSTTNSDGVVNITPERYERTVVVLSKYSEANQCTLPVIDSNLTASILVNSQFNYTLTASSTSSVTLSVSTTTLPAWLTFATTTNSLSGTPTQTGTYNVDLLATNTCGNDSKTLVITVTSGGGGGGSPTSDLSVIKTSDKSTANVGDTITYSIKVVNAGPNDATQVTLTDVLPATLTFVSSTSTTGSFATTTGIWTIGSLLNSASTTLTLVATVNAGTEGQSISNTATTTSAQTDPNGGNNISTVTTSVNPVPVVGCTSNCGGGGGGGGNGPISTFVPSNPSSPTVPTTPNSCYYLYDYLRADFNNNPVEVKKLQVFLRDLEGHSSVQITGIYDAQTIVALDSFQNKYKGDILTPWGHTAPTSYTYILTKKKVNEIYCRMAFPVNAQQQSEIDTYRNFLQGLRDSGVEFNVDTPVSNPSNWVINGQVGVISTSTQGKPAGDSPKENLATLAGYSSTTQNLVSNLTANVIASGKKFANALLGLFSFPFGSDEKKPMQCQMQCGETSGVDWLNIILLLIIAVISYLWYREYRNNKKIEEINKVIDLE